jgi:tryptophan synthase beta chain
MNMYTLGHDFMPPGIHAGGLRYHGDSPIISKLVHEGRMEAVAHRQRTVFEANVLFARVEGKLPAPEAGHGIASVIAEAADATAKGEDRVILFNYCGHGLLDLSAYEDHLAGTMPEEP